MCQTQEQGKAESLIPGSRNRITQIRRHEGTGMSGGTNACNASSWLDSHTVWSGLLGENPFVHSCLRLVVQNPGWSPSCFHSAWSTIRLHLECLCISLSFHSAQPIFTSASLYACQGQGHAFSVIAPKCPAQWLAHSKRSVHLGCIENIID